MKKEAKMPKWEEKYNSYNKEEASKRIEELEAKLNDKGTNKEDYKKINNELREEKKIFENVDKVKNLLELRDKLTQSKKEIQKEINRIETLQKAKEEGLKIEIELNKINEEKTKMYEELKEIKKEKEKLKEQLKNPSLKDDEKDKMNKQLEDLSEKEKNKKESVASKEEDNNKKYIDNQKILSENMESNEKFVGKDLENLKKEAFEIGTKISKINMVANNLMQGKSWESIDLALDNWKDRKYTSKEKLSEIATKKEVKETIVENVKNDNNEVEAVYSFEKQEGIPRFNFDKLNEERGFKEDEELEFEEVEELEFEENEKTETSLIKKSEFLTKHPKLAKMLDGIGKWIKSKFKSKEDVEPEVKEEKEEPKEESKEEPKEESKEESKVEIKEEVKRVNDFKNYLKDVAEKGMQQVDLERQYGPEKAKEILENKKQREERMSKGGFKNMDSKVNSLQQENEAEIRAKYDGER